MTLKLKKRQRQRSLSKTTTTVVIDCGPSSCVGGCNGRRIMRATMGTLLVLYVVLFRSAHRVVRNDERLNDSESRTSSFFGDNEQQQQTPSGGLLFHDAFPILHRLMKQFRPSTRTLNHATKDDVQQQQLVETTKQTTELINSNNGGIPSDTNLYRPFDGRLVVHHASTDMTTTTSSSSSLSVPDIWTTSEILPNWMKEYFEFHKSQREQVLTPEKWGTGKYVVIQCLDEFRKCGGTSDRLKPLPLLIRLAAQEKRILLIQWNRPCKLEEFLLPPVGGIDWRVPDWLAENIKNDGVLLTGSSIKNGITGIKRTYRIQYQSYDGGAGWYNEYLETDSNGNATEARFKQVYHDLWRVMFTPSPPIAKAILTVMNDKGLRPGRYVSAHLRLLYIRPSRIHKMMEKFTRNAVNCASTLRPGGPIFIASDATYVHEYGPKYGAEMGVSVVAHDHNPEPVLHLDRPDGMNEEPKRGERNVSTRPPSDFYDTFIDLYLLALGGCSFYGKGGYGLWGAMIGGENLKCKYQERLEKGVPDHYCDYVPGKVNTTSIMATDDILVSPFLEPMK